jgi:hypothetical protein
MIQSFLDYARLIIRDGILIKNDGYLISYSLDNAVLNIWNDDIKNIEIEVNKGLDNYLSAQFLSRVTPSVAGRYGRFGIYYYVPDLNRFLKYDFVELYDEVVYNDEFVSMVDDLLRGANAKK